MNHTMINGLCLVLSIATSVLSATLTTKFMFGIGSDIGSPMLMAALGLVLDLSKCAAPLFIFVLWSQRKYLSTLFAVTLSLTLSVVSFSASVAALENGVTASQQNSVSYQRIETQINDYRAQIVELRQLAQRQQDAKQITKSQKTLSQIPALLAHVDELSTQQSQLSSGDSVVSKYGMIISYIASAALELLSWLFVCVSFALKKSTHTQTHSCTVMHTQENMSVQPIDLTIEHAKTQSQSFTVPTHSNTVECANDDCFASDCDHCMVSCSSSQISSKCDIQLYFDIRNAILAKEVTPSIRGIHHKFKGVGRALISQVLTDLYDTGFLKNYRNGYAFA